VGQIRRSKWAKLDERSHLVQAGDRYRVRRSSHSTRSALVMDRGNAGPQLVELATPNPTVSAEPARRVCLSFLGRIPRPMRAGQPLGICAREPNGIVTKYRTARLASWAKIKNPDYSQPIGRCERFQRPRRSKRSRTSRRGAMSHLSRAA